MKKTNAFLIIFYFLIVNLPAQSDTIRYYFDKKAYFEHYESSFSSFAERIKREAKKNIRIYHIPLYCFNDSIKNYDCGKNLEPMIDFTQWADLQTLFVVKRKKIKLYHLFIDRFYEEIKQGNIKANKEVFKGKLRGFDETFINQSDGPFYPFMILRGYPKQTFFQKIRVATMRKHFPYGQLWKFIDKHPDAHVFQIAFVPGYWAIMDEKLIRINNGKKIEILDANTYFCALYAPCAVRLVYGKDSTYMTQQEECEKIKYNWPNCRDCKTIDFQNIILINENGNVPSVSK